MTRTQAHSAHDPANRQPDALRALYNTQNYTATNAKGSQAATSFLEQYWSTTDLQEFWKMFSPKQENDTLPTMIGNNTGMPGTEAELDVQYLTAGGIGVATTMFYTPGRMPNSPDNEPWFTWLKTVSAMSDPPAVISASYGEDEKSVGMAYAARSNTEFMKLGARGISILVAAGDSGTGGNCTASKGRFNPNWPTGSPYVTSVGGTWGGTAGQHPTGESVDGIGGGGFSDYWGAPSWQKDATKNYVSNKTNLPPAKVFNATGRGYPDLAAQSEGYVVVQFGIPLPGVGGTSCATPTWSGIIALLNDVRLNAGKSNLGFLNPMLYQLGAASLKKPAAQQPFNDVTTGQNEGCGNGGFTAREGWDPASGWGTPNFEALKGAVLALP